MCGVNLILGYSPLRHVSKGYGKEWSLWWSLGLDMENFDEKFFIGLRGTIFIHYILLVLIHGTNHWVCEERKLTLIRTHFFGSCCSTSSFNRSSLYQRKMSLGRTSLVCTDTNTHSPPRTYTTTITDTPAPHRHTYRDVQRQN